MQHDTNKTRQGRIDENCCPKCGKPRIDGRKGKCAVCLSKEKAEREERTKEGRCPRCNAPKPKELGLCLECGLPEEDFQNLEAGDYVTLIEKHPKMVNKLKRGRS